jgi:tetratricopeptide (TPR) repeat protein
MRIICAFCAALLLSCAVPIPASAAPVQVAPAKARAARIDALFAALKRERNEKAAERIAQEIGETFLQSGSATTDLLMLWSQKAVEEQKYDVALDFLDEVVTLQPSYAEGWNRRATVHFLMKDYAKSLADIDETLKLEPRHFGALSGLAQIMADTGHKKDALAAWQRVLDIYPMMRSAQDQVATLSEELAGEAI